MESAIEQNPLATPVPARNRESSAERAWVTPKLTKLPIEDTAIMNGSLGDMATGTSSG